MAFILPESQGKKHKKLKKKIIIIKKTHTKNQETKQTNKPNKQNSCLSILKVPVIHLFSVICKAERMLLAEDEILVLNHVSCVKIFAGFLYP